MTMQPGCASGFAEARSEVDERLGDMARRLFSPSSMSLFNDLATLSAGLGQAVGAKPSAAALEEQAKRLEKKLRRLEGYE